MHPSQREKMAIRNVEDGGREAATFLRSPRTLSTGSPWSAAVPKTGRTHQIRVHLTHIGHPILADKMYAGRGPTFTLGDLVGPDHPDATVVLMGRQALHAHGLNLKHPITGTPISFNAPLPPDMMATLAALRAHRS